MGGYIGLSGARTKLSSLVRLGKWLLFCCNCAQFGTIRFIYVRTMFNTNSISDIIRVPFDA